MSIKKALTFIPAVLLGLLAVLPPAHADDYNEQTYLTFNQPVRVPVLKGQIVLSPGTYEFRLLNSNSADHNVVLVFNLNAQLVAVVPTVLTQYWVPDLNDLINHTMLTFAVSSNNQPLTLVSWFYPDQNFGHQMIYSKRIERQLSEERTVTVEGETVGPAVGNEFKPAPYGR